MSLAQFKYQKVKVQHLGTIFRPYAVVQIINQSGDLWIPIEMMADTGADYTILPKKYLPILGYDIKDSQTITTFGVGGPETTYFFPKVKVKLGQWTGTAPVGFLERDDVPALLGRYQFMDKLKSIFHQHVVKFE